MKVQLYTQIQPRVANIGIKPKTFAGNQNYSGREIGTLAPYNPYSTNFSQISFSALLKTNYIKEIYEQPEVIQKLVDKYFSTSGKVSNLELGLSKKDINKMTGIRIVASGSSKNVAEMARDFIEEVTGIPVDIQFASEFAHKKTVANKNDLMMFISQSGETADTFAALTKANPLNLKSIALTNTPGSKIHENATTAVEVGAGKELAVAATKSVTAQLINLYAIGLKLAEIKGTISQGQINSWARGLKSIPQNLEKMLKDDKPIKKIAKNLVGENIYYILGRGPNYGSTMEGALKLRETTYSNPVSSASGEFLHGYIASVDETTPVIQIVQGGNSDENYNLAYNNIKEIINKRSPQKVIIIKNQANKAIEEEPVFKNCQFIDIPSIDEKFSPVYVVSRFQMLANELTKIQGKNPDKPRSLTKAVLSE
ncbi:MAG: SIS domain-containing protein [Candidatus Gastranaerophilaceae bacterium]